MPPGPQTEFFAELERRRTTLVAVDEPNLPGLFPQLDVVTNPDLFYIRFHGRNVKVLALRQYANTVRLRLQ